MSLPPPGRWALGGESQALAEQLLAEARAQGLRTAWLGPEAGFLSNLSLQENLRLFHDWQSEPGRPFEAALQAALAALELSLPAWLLQRPSQLRSGQLLQASYLRVFLLRPAVVVLSPHGAGQGSAALHERLVSGFAEARLLLLAEAAADWPAWPPSEPVAAVETLHS